MRRRHLPRYWLMTDERMGDGLWPALARLPRGAGVVFRHHATPDRERRQMFTKVVRIARARELTVVRAGSRAMRNEAGSHNRIQRARGVKTFAVHNWRELVAAQRAGAQLVFVSPVFATSSHPGAPALGAVRLGLLVRRATIPVVALGGMNARRFRRLRALGVAGWGGIEAWLEADLSKAQVVSPRFCEAGRAWVRDAN